MAMGLAKIEIEYHGPVAFHNMPCPVCGVNCACLMMNSGVFLPCSTCTKDGWAVTRLNWWERWRRRNRIDYRKGADDDD